MDVLIYAFLVFKKAIADIHNIPGNKYESSFFSELKMIRRLWEDVDSEVGMSRDIEQKKGIVQSIMTFPFPSYCKHISLWLCLPNYSLQILINVLPFDLDTRTIFPVKLFSVNRSNRTLAKTGRSYFSCVTVGSTINTTDCWAAPGKLNTMQISSFHMQISPAYYACLQYINRNSNQACFYSQVYYF